jgi:glyoxylase-like metal-dependent hydrolase (beta-lactamase superfamily II)
MNAALSVTTLPVGTSLIPGPELFWMSQFDQWYPLTFQSVLVRGAGVVAIVNTGPARDLEDMNVRWESFLGSKARMQRGDDEFIIDQLAKHGVAPSDVTHVILTPLQLYTISNLLEFSNAQICISRRGWEHFHTTHEHPHDDRATSIPDEILVELVTSAWPRVRLLQDEDEISPGLRTWWCGGHHRASVVVEVDTSKGVVAISDCFFYERNVTENRPLGINESLDEIATAYERVRNTADIILPLYDPANFERFPDGLVAS